MVLPPPLDSGGGGKQRVGAQSIATALRGLGHQCRHQQSNWVTSLLGTRARSLASDACRLVSKSNECGHTAQPCAQARAGA